MIFGLLRKLTNFLGFTYEFQTRKELLNILEYIVNGGYGYSESLYSSINPELFKDKDLMLKLVKIDGYAIKFLADSFRNDKDIVKEAFINQSHSFRFASNELKNDKEFIIDLLDTCWKASIYASDELKKDREFGIAGVNSDVEVLQFLSEELRNDIYVVQAAVQNNEYAMQFVNDEIKYIVGDNDPYEMISAYIKTFEYAEELDRKMRNIPEDTQEKKTINKI